MEGRGVLFSRAAGGSSVNNVLFQNEMILSSSSTSSKPLDCIFNCWSPSSVFGPRTMVSFDGGNRPCKSSFNSFDQEGNVDEDLDVYTRQHDKKKRLTVDQVQFLERSFKAENKLEHESKVKLAKELGLESRHVTIWFQNRRARWKAKQLEVDYDVLQASYDHLKAEYDNLRKDNEKLKAEVLQLRDKLRLGEKGKSEVSKCNKLAEAPPSEPRADSFSDHEVSKLPTLVCNQEDISSARSYVIDSDSSLYVDDSRYSFLDPGESSYVFELDQSDISRDEQDNSCKTLLPPARTFAEAGVVDYTDPPTNCYFVLPMEDNPFGFWSTV